MKFCDVTIAYNEESGGIRTYIEEKRRHLLEHTTHEHLLIVPGESHAIERTGRATTVYVASPFLPTQDTYRLFARPDKLRDALLEERPDVIELGSYYVEAWACFGYRQRLQDAGQSCVIGCYFHTDVAEAYVGGPLRWISHHWLEERSETLATLADKFAAIAETGAERYIASVFDHCDLAIASSPGQAARLAEYGVADVAVVPLGVDLDLFNPARRSEETRAAYGATPDNTVLIYAGRLSSEKRVLVLIEALQRLPDSFGAMLWIVGQGPLRDELTECAARMPSLRILPYHKDREEFARLLASADIYVTAGPHETFGLSVIEAQACGLPVVGVDSGALRERVPSGLGFLGPVDEPAAMASNIVQAASDRLAIGKRARRHVEKNFSWDSSFRRLLAFYEAKLNQIELPLPSMSRLSLSEA